MSVFPHIETSQLICTANQLAGFYVRATLALNWLSGFRTYCQIQIKLIYTESLHRLEATKLTYV